MTIQEATEQLIQAIREDALAKLVVHFEQMRPGMTGPVAKYGKKRDPDAIRELTRRLYDSINHVGGQGIEQIAAALNVPSKDLFLPIKKLLANAMIRTTGQRRGTRYYAR